MISKKNYLLQNAITYLTYSMTSNSSKKFITDRTINFRIDLYGQGDGMRLPMPRTSCRCNVIAIKFEEIAILIKYFFELPLLVNDHDRDYRPIYRSVALFKENIIYYGS